jgi:hypothetical protein
MVLEDKTTLHPNTSKTNYMAPNALFKSHIDRLLPGTVLIPDDQTAANSVYAASRGWRTYTFNVDHSLIPQISKDVKTHDWDFNLGMSGYENSEYDIESMDIIAFLNIDVPTYVHQQYFQKLLGYLKKGGLVLMDAYHTDNLSLHPNPGSAMSEKMIKRLFGGFSSTVIKKVDNPFFAGSSRHASHFYKLQLTAIK